MCRIRYNVHARTLGDLLLLRRSLCLFLGVAHLRDADRGPVNNAAHLPTRIEVRRCPVRVERRVECEDAVLPHRTPQERTNKYLNHSCYLFRQRNNLGILISTHLLRHLKARCAYYVLRPTPRALRRLSYPVYAMNDQPGQDMGCDGVITYLPLTNAPDKRDEPIEQRREVKRCPAHVTRKVDCKDVVFLTLRGVQ
jgi:hypothetical protein